MFLLHLYDFNPLKLTCKIKFWQGEARALKKIINFFSPKRKIEKNTKAIVCKRNERIRLSGFKFHLHISCLIYFAVQKTKINNEIVNP